MSTAATAIRPEEHLGLAHLLVRRIVRSARNVDEVDLAGEAVLALVVAAPHFDPDRGLKPSTFLGKAVTRAVLHALKRRRHRLLRTLPHDEDGQEIEREDHRSGEHLTAEQAEDTARLNQWMQRLTTQERHVLQLRFGSLTGEEHTLEQIGQVLNLTRERIRQIEAQALRRLRAAAGCDREDAAQSEAAETVSTAG